ncbi:MAG: 2-polyprenylphenol 6-hydroxylase, partial [Alphaproteobacteria bacterium]
YSVCARSKKHNALKAIGRSLTRFLQNNGPSFIKLGQILSTRPDLTGQEISSELSRLQDRLKPFDFSYVREEIRTHFGKEISEIFSEFEETPRAAASIAQVHKAIKKDGSVVAVKILRPNIEKRFAQDISFFKFFIGFIKLFSSESFKRLKLTEVVSMLYDVVKFELDLRFEAAACDTIKQNCAKDPGFLAPTIHWDLISTRILVTSWIDGIPVNDKERILNSGIDPKIIAQNLAISFFNQAYRDGFFHADLHQGNIFALNNGDIAMVDFGIVGALPKADRMYIAEILYGFITRDYDRVAEVHFKAGYVPLSQNKTTFMLACRAIGEPIIGRPVNQISIAHLLKQLLEVTKQFNMETQPQLLLLQKTMVTLEGVGYSIYPDVNMWQLAEPWIKNWAHDNFGIKARANDLYHNVRYTVERIPSILDDIDKLTSHFTDHIIIRKKRSNLISTAIIGFAAGLACVTLILLA